MCFPQFIYEQKCDLSSEKSAFRDINFHPDVYVTWRRFPRYEATFPPFANYISPCVLISSNLERQK